MLRRLSHFFLLLGLLLFATPDAALAQSRTSSKSTSKKSTATRKSTSGTKKSTPQRARPKPTPGLAPATFNGLPVTTIGSVLMFDPATGRTLFEKNADERRPPASTQKLLTALILVETGNLDKRVVIQHSDTLAEPSKLYLKTGESYTRRELLEVLLVRSFNDVAMALARDNAGSIKAFAAKMNRRAAALGMTQSHFVNPNGLPAPGQLSTARDMARLASVVYRNPTIRRICATKEIQFKRADGRIRTYNNTNRVLRGWPYCTGLKTGYTHSAGYCLISSASRDGREVVVVGLGNKTPIWQESCSLLAWGLSH
ncbi:MAG TPA: D-alanyl-D-alanine carboxypeptidase family protein [Chthoniobacteraceae bacterium]|nr:D-alanyl-D-alanine carboxypeptidase family protein [Chthoniobacteraceae bacterium]